MSVKTTKEHIASVTSASAVEERRTSATAGLKRPLQTDWDGLDDSSNPRNWKLGKKLYATAVPALYAFCVYVAFYVGFPPI